MKHPEENSCHIQSLEEKLASLIITSETGNAYHANRAKQMLIRWAKQVHNIPDPVITVKKSELKSFNK